MNQIQSLPHFAGVTAYQNENGKENGFGGNWPNEISPMMDETKQIESDNSELPKFLHGASKEIIDQV